MLKSVTVSGIAASSTGKNKILARLDYDAGLPLEIMLTIAEKADELNDPLRTVQWVIGRDLLFEGLGRPSFRSPAGDGDVKIKLASTTSLEILLHNGVNAGRIFLPVFKVAAFLDETFEIVPRGEEYSLDDIDREINILLGRQLWNAMSMWLGRQAGRLYLSGLLRPSLRHSGSLLMSLALIMG
jgi:hypothetical protein